MSIVIRFNTVAETSAVARMAVDPSTRFVDDDSV